MAVVKGKIFFKVKTNCFYSQCNYPLPRTVIEAVWCSGADRRSFEASAVPILVYLYIVIMVHKYRQSAKRKVFLKRNTVPEVFPLTIGSGKTMPFEKRHAGCEEREKINRRRIYDTLRINFFEATKQTACIFSKGGDG